MIAASVYEISSLKFQTEERKVRTPEGNEPANGGAPTKFQMPNSKCGRRVRDSLGDDKCNREKTSHGLA